ncbi:tyrosine-type recombinase/integrase [Aestuariivirga sp.]|uniref:tyrosine-type recombinase/integrase n=1 Tax=Aestuariivirga sp. TaxID=2650926 RepID=UPI0039E5F678
MAKLTKKKIEGAEAPVKPQIMWDDELRGFGLLVLPSGVKTFIYQYRNKAKRSRRLTIGRYGALTVDDARKIVRETVVEIANGGDPVSQRQIYRGSPTIADLLERYLSDHAAIHNAATTQKDVTALVRTRLVPRIGNIKASDLTRADAARLHLAMRETPRRANYALAVLSKALSLAEIWGIRPENSNPCRSIKRYKEEHRTRFLSKEEVQRLGQSLAEAETLGMPWRVSDKGKNSKHLAKPENQRTVLSWQFIAAIRLLLLSGARLSEIIELEWAHIDFENGTVKLPSRKGGKREPHPVGNAVMETLNRLPRITKSKFVLPRPDDPTRHITKEVMEVNWQRIRQHAKIDDVRIHDLRHTVGTYAAQAGISGFIVRDLLRHKNIATTSRYANFDASPVRDVSNTVGDMLSANLKGEA